jgi:hypothetical protein
MSSGRPHAPASARSGQRQQHLHHHASADAPFVIAVRPLIGEPFDLCVTSADTIAAVKAKIHRQEGIPAMQQHLVFNESELLDHYTLGHYHIAGGATIRLVLQLRGGPINPRRMPSDESMLTGLADAEEAALRLLLEEENLYGLPVTLVIVREADRICLVNILRDGTPLSDGDDFSCSSRGSLYPFGTFSAAQSSISTPESRTSISRRVQENAQMRQKMKHIRASLAEQKKPPAGTASGAQEPLPQLQTTAALLRPKPVRSGPSLAHPPSLPPLPPLSRRSSNSGLAADGSASAIAAASGSSMGASSSVQGRQQAQRRPGALSAQPTSRRGSLVRESVPGSVPTAPAPPQTLQSASEQRQVMAMSMHDVEGLASASHPGETASRSFRSLSNPSPVFAVDSPLDQPIPPQTAEQGAAGSGKPRLAQLQMEMTVSVCDGV